MDLLFAGVGGPLGLPVPGVGGPVALPFPGVVGPVALPLPGVVGSLALPLVGVALPTDGVGGIFVLPLDIWGGILRPLVGDRVGGGLVLAACLPPKVARVAVLLDLDVAALVPTTASSALL